MVAMHSHECKSKHNRIGSKRMDLTSGFGQTKAASIVPGVQLLETGVRSNHAPPHLRRKLLRQNLQRCFRSGCLVRKPVPPTVPRAVVTHHGVCEMERWRCLVWQFYRRICGRWCLAISERKIQSAWIGVASLNPRRLEKAFCLTNVP